MQFALDIIVSHHISLLRNFIKLKVYKWGFRNERCVLKQEIREQDLESDRESSVWYAVYGSNLLKERFMCYLEGKEFRSNTTVLMAPPRCEA